MQLDGRELTKAEIARINGSKGRGPITARGKEIVCRNSLKHGLAAQRFTVLADEDENEYKMLLTSVYRRVTPSGEKEEKIATRMANAVWRLRRIERWERDAEKMNLYRNIHRYESVLLREYKKAGAVCPLRRPQAARVS